MTVSNRRSIHRLSPSSDVSIFSGIAELHKNAISEGYLASFDVDFLAHVYVAISANSDSFCYYVMADDRPIGFIAGSTSSARLMRDFALSARGNVLRALIPALVERFQPVRLLELVRHMLTGGAATSGEILNFAVSRGSERMGIGTELFATAVEEFRDRGSDEIEIVTGDRQLAAQRFYENIGARRTDTLQIHRGVTSLRYIYDIS